MNVHAIILLAMVYFTGAIYVYIFSDISRIYL